MKFTDLLSLYKIPYKEGGEHHHVREGWIGIDCPYCSRNSQRYRMGYNLQSSRLYCWVCGKQPLGKTLMEITDESYPKLKSLIGELERSYVPDIKVYGKVKIPAGVGDLHRAHRDYLRKRGFDPDEIMDVWSIQGIGIAGRLAWRLFIPITFQRKIVSWTTRSIAFNASERGQGRYISARAEESAMSIKTLLYGEDNVNYAIAVCEGPTDAWALGIGAVATLGVGYTEAQLIRISKYPERYIVFDSEPDAQKRAHKLCSDLSVFPGSTHNIILETGKDPASASKKEIQEIRRLLV